MLTPVPECVGGWGGLCDEVGGWGPARVTYWRDNRSAIELGESVAARKDTIDSGGLEQELATPARRTAGAQITDSGPLGAGRPARTLCRLERIGQLVE